MNVQWSGEPGNRLPPSPVRGLAREAKVTNAHQSEFRKKVRACKCK